MLKEDFEIFCDNIQNKSEGDMRVSAGRIAKKLNNEYYGLTQDEETHLYIVGSVGRGTSANGCSDMDIIFDLPDDVYSRFDKYESNGQSALLQEVKEVLLETFPKTTIKGDGQVVVLQFSRYKIEVLPAFRQEDDSFKYPNSHEGGSWKYTKPLAEIDACKSCNESSNGIFNDMCRMMRCWKNNVGFVWNGLLIDTLVHHHLCDNDNYSNSDANDYLDILKNLFEYLSAQNADQAYWHAVGSNQQVKDANHGRFVREAKKAKGLLCKLNTAEENGAITDVNEVLRKLFGNKFPRSEASMQKASRMSVACRTEQFIEDLYRVDVRCDVTIDCVVTPNGFRSFSLRDYLQSKPSRRLPRNRSLTFRVVDGNYPPDSKIYWKVRNVGEEAMRRNMIRGQILKTGQATREERTTFCGPHFVECYVIYNEVCVARDRIDVPIE